MARVAPTVLEALRRFLPEHLASSPRLSADQRRAVRAITRCRTPALGGRAFACRDCSQTRFAWHSCNHKACPQCGRAATAQWVRREGLKLVDAPYFLVTFTLPAEIRPCFFGPLAREAYDLFFKAVSRALSEKLCGAKGLKARVNGFTAVLHTWTQRLEFHPHIHCPVPDSTTKAGSCACAGTTTYSICRSCRPPSGNTCARSFRSTAGRSIRRSGPRTGACTSNPPATGRRR